MTRHTHNTEFIAHEAAWFERVLRERLVAHAEGDASEERVMSHHPPHLPEHGAPYAEVVRRAELSHAERLILMLAFLPHAKPEALDPLLLRSDALQRRFTEFGGRVSSEQTAFLPTQQTALFLLAGSDLPARLNHLRHFRPDAPLYARHILTTVPHAGDDVRIDMPLRLDADCLERLLTGGTQAPVFSTEFPAQHLTTPYAWDDLVLDDTARTEVDDILAWQRHAHTLLHGWQLEKRLKPGYRTLFYGPSGTGKTLTACLIGKATGDPVYRIDLSKVVSKWIGETEKNLAALFDRAEHGGMILFFDEADSLFGRRTETRSANDRAANQQIAYLLQRIEDFPGLVILASNLRGNIDEAFSRRFESIVAFPMPNAEQRRRLWEDNFRDKPYRLAHGVDLQKLARDYELSGGSIVNVLRYTCLKAVVREPQTIAQDDLVAGVRRELRKDGKYLG